uniref:Thioredoxin-like protein 1 n=1 Tax=Graphocephala atropunctata TaxID=36148 RepID=A0A1B6MHB8_9HEMI
MSVITIANDNQFQTQLSSNAAKLVVVDFTASWCGPCLRIAPVYEQLSRTYNRAVFLKVDVDVCQDTAAAQGVSSMPTFMFFRNRTRIDRMSGADPRLLEEKIRQYYNTGLENEEESVPNAQGHMDLTPFIMSKQCEALNESNTFPLANCLQADDNYLESSCDNQLIISITFSQAVKIHSIKFKAPAANGPKIVKLFINQPNTLDFDEATNNVPTQILEINPNDLAAGNAINLRFVKFQNVQNIQIFVQDNQDGSDVTRIDHLQLIGSPIVTTNMSDFKRVAGKKGELHY